jgi:hypothetical protein
MGDVARAEEPPEEEGWRGREAKTRGGRSSVVWTPEILRKESARAEWGRVVRRKLTRLLRILSRCSALSFSSSFNLIGPPELKFSTESHSPSDPPLVTKSAIGKKVFKQSTVSWTVDADIGNLAKKQTW